MIHFVGGGFLVDFSTGVGAGSRWENSWVRGRQHCSGVVRRYLVEGGALEVLVLSMDLANVAVDRAL
jgi:hypothetical protein